MQLNNVFVEWLKANKISEKVQQDFNIGFDDRIIFPVCDTDGNFLFNKYRRSPLTDIGPKYTYDQGGKVSLYGYHKAKLYDTILITEGEKDCLVAWSHNIPAVTSTGGAMSFQKEWVDLFIDDIEDGQFADQAEGKDVILCYDNDQAGADGMVKTLEVLPWAKVVFIPNTANVKDLSEYVNMGGDLHELLKTAKHFKDIAEVSEDKARRLAKFESVTFHDSYIRAHTKVQTHSDRKMFSSDKVTHAKAYPIPNLMEFKQNKAKCLWHSERTGSLTYFPKTNSCYCFGCNKVADAIEVYKTLNNISFKEAVEQLNKM